MSTCCPRAANRRLSVYYWWYSEEGFTNTLVEGQTFTFGFGINNRPGQCQRGAGADYSSPCTDAADYTLWSKAGSFDPATGLWDVGSIAAGDYPGSH